MLIKAAMQVFKMHIIKDILFSFVIVTMNPLSRFFCFLV